MLEHCPGIGTHVYACADEAILPVRTSTKGSMKTIDVRAVLLKANISYNYCGICGRVPKQQDEPNYAPLRWWDPDDGWKVGTLCSWCAEDALPREPKHGDFAFNRTNGLMDDSDTDEDHYNALEGLL